MSIFGLPLIMFQVPEVDDDLGDLEFIQTKVLSADYFQESGDINAFTNTIEFIVPNLKTAFMIEAKIINPTHPTPAGTPSISVTQQVSMVTADFKIDGVTKDKAVTGERTSAGNQNNQHGGGTGNGYGMLSDGRFNVHGLSLVGDGIKKIEIENTLDNGVAFATMSGYLIDT